ncbi:trimethylguanosine synthase [Methylomagnum ishizawai]|uniref:Trimethylguanosine synthase n=1 Tax=Methylomagnum ishizawai TaxID=1760988 RepID=A0A1Y6D101_9GAMM|nr:methyltransferase domain-containing protein [Methylomagnum ishizawai]SMF96291.1 trimethylguanosine synthase [Methylomagnum ishizawai]
MEMDLEGLYSLDLQALALELAERIRSPRVVDAFCGIGGAAIAFARRGKQVDAIELQASRLDMARRNAQRFGVEDRIHFLEGDCTEKLEPAADTAIYLDPPWGGPAYGKLEQFRLKDFSPDGATLLRQALAVSPEVLFKLPKNFDFADLQRISAPTAILRNEFRGNLEYYTAVFLRNGG